MESPAHRPRSAILAAAAALLTTDLRAKGDQSFFFDRRYIPARTKPIPYAVRYLPNERRSKAITRRTVIREAERQGIALKSHVQGGRVGWSACNGPNLWFPEKWMAASWGIGARHLLPQSQGRSRAPD